ncbi:MAG: SPOR domain-containing protein, partial [Nitrospinaceae bacterium]
MSIELTLEKPDFTEEPTVRYTKRIDDLIEDAEIEAEIEAEQKIRAKNTRLVTISIVAAGVLVFLYLSTRNSPDSDPLQAPVEQASASLPVAAGSGLNRGPEPMSPVENQAELIGSPLAAAMPLEQVASAPTAAVNSGNKTALTLKAPAKQAPVNNNPSSNAIKDTPQPPAAPTVRGATLNSLGGPPVLKAANDKPLPKPPPTVTALGRYFVQVGAFSKKGNADRLTENLKTKGFAPVTLPKTVTLAGGKKTVHVVRVGSYP